MDAEPSNLMRGTVTGTAVFGFVIQSGILFASDTRLSNGLEAKKVFPVGRSPHTLLVGGSGTYMCWDDKRDALAGMCVGSNLTVSQAADFVEKMMREKRMTEPYHRMLIGGGGSTDEGPIIYVLESKPVKKLLGDLFFIGSGYEHVGKYVRSELYRTRRHPRDMTLQEGIEYGKKAILYAMLRDSHTGGNVNVHFLSNDTGRCQILVHEENMKQLLGGRYLSLRHEWEEEESNLDRDEL
ncbi:proteasome subunit beta type [Striga asiatica]|uniref:Proteasome subunit beta type n=1 Tax=Striga asiatica TaxID=4170 RepID=A0A5A7PSE8_STRAF|nr:proteasome subunit beta type [Striga asiatica]